MHTTKIGILRQYLASSHAANAATASCLINAIDGRYLAIDRCLLELMLSTDGGSSSGVSQSPCKSVYGTESHATVNTPKRRKENII